MNTPHDRSGARPLLKRAAIADMTRALSLAGATQASDVLLADIDRHASLLERCVAEAEKVLFGSADAAARLWLLLREPIDAGPAIPRSILHDLAGQAGLTGPLSMDGDVLLRVVAGVVRAANTPGESELMLESLGRLLLPFFQLDVAAVAAAQAQHGRGALLETFVSAHSAPRWRVEAQRSIDPAVVRDPAAHVLDLDRAEYDAASWRDTVVKPAIGDWASFWVCPGGVRLAMSQIDRFGPRFTITSILNAEACAGQTVTIRGSNFGPSGRVYFQSPDIRDPAFALGDGDPAVMIGVTPKSWTNTEVEVVVPVWATAGEVHLFAFTRHVDPCTTIEVHRLGNSVFFQGGLANVYRVSIRGVEIDLNSTQPTNLTPGDAVALAWHTSGGPTTRVKVQLMDGATVLWERSNLPGGFGGTVLTVPDPDPKEPRSATLVFTVTSACGVTRPRSIPVWLSVPPRLTITYIEVTQGVQGDLSDVLAGRGMPTVAHKDTAVRVHMNCDRGGWFSNKLGKITGALLVDGRRLAPTNVRVMVPPDRGFASIRGLSDAGVTNDTVNFTIPAAWLTPGTHQLAVTIVCDDPSGKITLGQTIAWNWPAHAPIRVRSLYMALYGSDEFLLDYARRALDYLPTPLTDIGIAAPRWYSHTYDLSDGDGWNDLLDDLEDAWDDADEASGVRWLGIVPASERFIGRTLAHQGISGTPSIAVLAMGDRPDVGAHELGHSLGLHHINLPAGVPKGPFDPADSGGMLRRPPFDVRASKAIPLPAGDLMTYFEPVRPGISTWMRLFLNT